MRSFLLAALAIVSCPAWSQAADPAIGTHKGGLDPKVADFLQQVAADTVREYLGKDL